MALPTPPVEQVECVGIDDFSSLRGRTFGTVLVDLDTHRVIDLLPDRETETAMAWLQGHREITHVSRDRGSEYASAASRGAPREAGWRLWQLPTGLDAMITMPRELADFLLEVV
jgi:transposase